MASEAATAAPVYAAATPADLISAWRPEATIESARSVGGGCINSARALELTDGTRVFLKSNPRAAADMFAAEAHGLSLLADAGVIRVPRPLALASDGTMLLLEYIAPGQGTAAGERDLGHRLAELHRTARGAAPGLDRDTYLGTTRQPNSGPADWFAFFGTNRLAYLADKLAAAGGPDLRAATARLVGRLPDLLPHVDDAKPSLLHGDLWGGNVMFDRGGAPVVIDPAVSYGHREADLAMTALFGGFGREFYAAYQEAWPTEPGYRDRFALYNLYHVLNHAVLFGGGYAAQARATLGSYV